MSFLKSLLSKVSGKTPATLLFDSKPSSTPETALSLASHIPDNYLPLWQLQKQRQQLEVKLGSASRVYQSMIIAIDVERGLLWLDDLFPQQFIIDIGDEITLRHHRNGEQLIIRAPIVALGSNFGASGLAIVLPEDVTYSPRRNSPRFTVNANFPLMVKIRTLGQEPCYGTLQDISTGGMRLNVAGNMLAQLRHGALLPLCEAELDDGLHIRCRAKICAFRINRTPSRSTQISIEFLDLPDEKKQDLAYFLQQSLLPNPAKHCAA